MFGPGFKLFNTQLRKKMIGSTMQVHIEFKKGDKMAEKLKRIENDLHKYEFGLENGLITKKEYDELTIVLSFELKQLADQL